jgi:ATP-dependent helicase/nuclease subunit A
MSSYLSDILIRASAGTGKTYQLANRYVRLLEADVPPETILAATFTRKAAGEILERILLTLAHAASDGRKCAELGYAIDAPKLTPARCVELLARLTRRLHRLQVGTLDSFFARLAASFSLELELPPGWRILEDLDAARLRSAAIESLLESSSEADLARLLRLMTKGTAARSVSELIDATVKNARELFLETTAEAWRKVPTPPHPTARDLQSVPGRLRELPPPSHKNIQKSIEADAVMAEQEQWDEMPTKGILSKLADGEFVFYKKPIEGEVRATYEWLLELLRSLLLNRLARQTEATRELLERFDIEYREMQRRTGGCGFTDLARALAGRREPLPLETKNAEPDAESSWLRRAAFRCDVRLSHLLLDEFQDTSLLQWQVLRPFAEQVLSKTTTHINPTRERGTKGKQASDPSLARRANANLNNDQSASFFCVGDLKQAIYGWRGGDARIFDTLQRQLPGLQPESLNQSYRSAQPIIDVVNQVFSQMIQHPNLGRSEKPLQEWSRRFPTHETAKKELAGHVRLSVAPAKTDDDESQNDVTLRHAARLVADLAREAPGRSIGVLVRRNEVVAKLIFELQSLGLPASEEGGNPLTDSAAVRLVLSLLRLADHPGDTVSRCHVATSPLGVALDFIDFRDDSAAAALAARVRRQLLIDGYGPSVAAWVKLLSERCNPRELSRLEQLTGVAYSDPASATLRTRDFIEQVETARVADPRSTLVRVMTVHQAKGLQFDIVVLPELDVDLLGQEPSLVAGNADPTEPPNAVCLYRNEHIRRLFPAELQCLFEQDVVRRTHEALCVLYVALTRAVHALHLLIAPSGKPPVATFAGLLRAALADNAAALPEATLFEVGDPQWVSRTPKDAQHPLRTTMEPQPLRIRFAPALPTPVRGWQRAAPSQHEESRADRRLSELLASSDLVARERGTLIHKWFEQIEWLDAGQPAAEQLLAAARSLPPMSIEPASLLPEFFTMLDKPVIARLLTSPAIDSQASGAASAPRFSAAIVTTGGLTPPRSPTISPTLRVLREHPFAWREGVTLVSGVIDRLVLWQAGDQVVAAELLDFKTDAVPASGPVLDARIATYRPQLESYRRAVSRLFAIEASCVAARLLFVNPGVAVSV